VQFLDLDGCISVVRYHAVASRLEYRGCAVYAENGKDSDSNEDYSDDIDSDGNEIYYYSGSDYDYEGRAASLS